MRRWLLLGSAVLVALALACCTALEDASRDIQRITVALTASPTIASPGDCTPEAPAQQAPTQGPPAEPVVWQASRAAPTSAGATSTPTPMPTPRPTSCLADVPETEPELADWLADGWRAGWPADEVESALAQAGWIAARPAAGDCMPYRPITLPGTPTPSSEPGYRYLGPLYQPFVAADLDGNGADEWTLSVRFGKGIPAMCCHWMQGGLWVIGQQGRLLHTEVVTPGWSVAPEIFVVEDLTGDGLPELVAVEFYCGVHTSTSHIYVISGHGGQVRSIVGEGAVFRAASNLRNGKFYDLEDGPTTSITAFAAVLRIVDGSPSRLEINGGHFASAGAGIQREFVETWAWDGSRFTMESIRPDEWISGMPPQRNWVLYDGNFAFALGDLSSAIEAYERVISDASLVDPKPLAYDSASEALRQFAAFRLELIYLRLGDEDKAAEWRDWFHANYPQGGCVAAADALFAEWQETHDLRESCRVATNSLGRDSGLGVLSNLGYGNPELELSDACPVSQFQGP